MNRVPSQKFKCCLTMLRSRLQWQTIYLMFASVQYNLGYLREVKYFLEQTCSVISNSFISIFKLTLLPLRYKLSGRLKLIFNFSHVLTWERHQVITVILNIVYLRVTLFLVHINELTNTTSERGNHWGLYYFRMTIGLPVTHSSNPSGEYGWTRYQPRIRGLSVADHSYPLKIATRPQLRIRITIAKMIVTSGTTTNFADKPRNNSGTKLITYRIRYRSLCMNTVYVCAIAFFWLFPIKVKTEPTKKRKKNSRACAR